MRVRRWSLTALHLVLGLPPARMALSRNGVRGDRTERCSVESHSPRAGFGGVCIEAARQFSPLLSITECRCKTITLPNSRLGNSPYALVEQRFGPELNGDLTTRLLFGILEQTHQCAPQVIEPLTNLGRPSEVRERRAFRITG